MIKPPGKNRIRVLLIRMTVIFLFFSCEENNKNKIASVEPAPTYLPPVTFLLDTMPPPKRTELKDVPPPIITLVPKTKGGSYTIKNEQGEERINLFSPLTISTPEPIKHFTNFTSDDGLSSSNVLSGFMDKKGQLWFGTVDGGVSKYDGMGFTKYTSALGLADNVVYCMAEDKKGNLWFGTNVGASCFDGVRFKTFTTKNGLADNFVFSIVKDKNENLWFGTSNGVSRFDGIKFTTIDTSNGLPSNNVNRIIEDMSGNLWFATYGGGVCRYDGQHFTTFTTNNGLKTNYILSLYEDADSNLWIGNYEKGICKIDGNTVRTIAMPAQLSNQSVYNISADKNGNLWFTTWGDGVYKYDKKNFTSVNDAQGLINNAVNCIITDKTGNIWFGTQAGLSCYKGEAVNIFTGSKGFTDLLINAITEDESGNLWLGTQGNGAVFYDGKQFKSFSVSQGLRNNSVFAIIKDRSGKLWFGTMDNGIHCYDGTQFTNYSSTQGLGGNRINVMMCDKSGNLWIGYDPGGVSRFDGYGFTNFTNEQGLPDNFVSCLFEDSKENLWFGTQGGGACRFDGKYLMNFTTKQGLGDNIVNKIIEAPAGIFWIATGNGISRYDGKSFYTITTRDGLPANNVNDIKEDRQGDLWIGTTEGICRLRFDTSATTQQTSSKTHAGLLNVTNDELRNLVPSWEIYSVKTGFPLRNVWTSGLYISKRSLPHNDNKDSNIIWSGFGDTKFTRFNPNAIIKSTEPIDAFIRSIKVESQDINWYALEKVKKDSLSIERQESIVYGKSLTVEVRDSMQHKFQDIQFDSITPFYQLPLNLVLPYRHNRVSFDFGAIETSRPFMVRYQYMLEGYDDDWSPVTEKTTATYGNINEGSYTFKLKARSPEGVWSKPITYTFKVLPPWWRTWWFRSLMGLAILSLLYIIYRWRTATLHQQKRKLEQTVKERTAEVVKQKEKSDELLLNILPSEVAEELKEKGYTTAKSFDEVTILFSDIKGFTHVAERLTPEDLVKEIDTYFSAFDRVMQQYGLEKIKTIGDAYIAAGGLPEKNSATAQHVVQSAIDMQNVVEKLKQERIASNKPYFELRIGIHSGPVVAGVVGLKKFQYDIWGDTVNLAARMEQSGVPGKINISQHTYELVKRQFNCVPRGKIEAKNKGEIDMYFVE